MTTYGKGLLITVMGVLVISPDALLIRLVAADTWTLAFWRGLLSGSVILAVLLMSRERHHARFWLVMGWPEAWIALIFALGSLCFVYAITHTLVANTLFLTATSPVFAALISRFVLNEPVSVRTWAAIAAALFGVGIIASGSYSGAGSIAGDAAAIGAALSLAATFCIARARRARSMVPAMGVAGLLSAALVLPIAPTLVVAQSDWLWVGCSVCGCSRRVCAADDRPALSARGRCQLTTATGVCIGTAAGLGCSVRISR